MGKYRELTEKEQKWISEFSKIMAKAPNTLFMFVAGGVLIGQKDENNERYLKNGCSMDNEQPWITVKTKMEVDGGEW